MEVYENLRVKNTGDDICIHAPCRNCPYNNHDGFFCNMEYYESKALVNQTKEGNMN